MNCGTQDVVVDPKSRRTKIYKKGVRHEDVSEDESNKRNGEEVGFDLGKIENAIRAANEEVDNIYKLNEFQVRAIADDIAGQVKKSTHAIHVEDIQDMVETGIMGMRGYEVAQKYVRYRYKRELARKSNTTDNGILALIDNINEEVNQENSNKNPVINPRREIIWQEK